MIPKFHELDDIFEITFRAPLGTERDLSVEIPNCEIAQGQIIRLSVPSKNFDERVQVAKFTPVPRETKHDLDILRVDCKIVESPPSAWASCDCRQDLKRLEVALTDVIRESLD